MELRTDIPIPTASEIYRGNRGNKYPFPTMTVGSSFSVPKADAEKVSNAARMWRQRHPGWGFVCRRVGPDEYRLWRTS